jgi:uncharacterized protein YjbI with pentapeptide repeats
MLIEADEGHPVVVRVDGLAVDYQAAIMIALRLPADWNLPVRNLRETVVANLDPGVLGLSDGRLGAVDLTRASFTGDTWFGAIFTGRASFDGAIFTGRARFSGATFTDGASFDGTTFTDGAWFDEAIFTGDASFGGATFTDDAWFGGATFSDDAWFEGATFNGRALFSGATFDGDASFAGANAKLGLILPEGVDPGPEFRQEGGEPSVWYRREADPAPPSSDGGGA